MSRNSSKTFNAYYKRHTAWLRAPEKGPPPRIDSFCHIPLINLDLSRLNLYRADLRNLSMHNCDLSDTMLVEANLSESFISDVSFQNANASLANFAKAHLLNVSFQGTKLNNAKFNVADLLRTSFQSALLAGVQMIDTKVRGVRGDGDCIWNLDLPQYNVMMLGSDLQIGCQCHPHAEWTTFDEARISSMSESAFAWWTQYRDVVLQVSDIYQRTRGLHNTITR